MLEIPSKDTIDNDPHELFRELLRRNTDYITFQYRDEGDELADLYEPVYQGTSPLRDGELIRAKYANVLMDRGPRVMHPDDSWTDGPSNQALADALETLERSLKDHHVALLPLIRDPELETPLVVLSGCIIYPIPGEELDLTSGEAHRILFNELPNSELGESTIETTQIVGSELLALDSEPDCISIYWEGQMSRDDPSEHEYPELVNDT